MSYGEGKSPAFTRFSNQVKDKRAVFYLQPSLFVEDAQEFLKAQQDQMDSLARLYPGEEDGGEVADDDAGDGRQVVVNHLRRTNVDMIGKMGILIDLTKRVIRKMKLQSQAERAGSVGGTPLVNSTKIDEGSVSSLLSPAREGSVA